MSTCALALASNGRPAKSGCPQKSGSTSFLSELVNQSTTGLSCIEGGADETKDSSVDDSLPESISAATESMRKLNGSEVSSLRPEVTTGESPAELWSLSGALSIVVVVAAA